MVFGSQQGQVDERNRDSSPAWAPPRSPACLMMAAPLVLGFLGRAQASGSLNIGSLGSGSSPSCRACRLPARGLMSSLSSGVGQATTAVHLRGHGRRSRRLTLARAAGDPRRSDPRLALVPFDERTEGSRANGRLGDRQRGYRGGQRGGFRVGGPRGDGHGEAARTGPTLQCADSRGGGPPGEIPRTTPRGRHE